MNTFIKSLVVGGLSLACVAASGATVFAQDDTLPVQKPFRVKLGGLFGGGEVKGANGIEIGKIDYRFSAGIAYDFSKTNATSPVLFNIYADYFTGSDDKTINNVKVDSEATTFAIGIGARYLFAPAVGTAGQPYGELGLGYYSTKLDIGSSDDTEGGLGGKIALGYQLSMGLFGEVEYTIVDKFSKGGVDYEPSGIRASIGYRF
ncbi:MAG: porin family protein [Akkermansiaceae bacterium]|nr:porin family protein [Armatimonadota bacterium]